MSWVVVAAFGLGFLITAFAFIVGFIVAGALIKGGVSDMVRGVRHDFMQRPMGTAERHGAEMAFEAVLRETRN